MTDQERRQHEEEIAKDLEELENKEPPWWKFWEEREKLGGHDAIRW